MQQVRKRRLSGVIDWLKDDSVFGSPFYTGRIGFIAMVLPLLLVIPVACSSAASPTPTSTSKTTEWPGTVYHDLVNRATCWYIFGGTGVAIDCIPDSQLRGVAPTTP